MAPKRPNNMHDFSDLMLDILDKCDGDPMGGLKREWTIPRWENPKEPKGTITGNDADVAVFVDDFRDEVWRHTFFPRVERVRDDSIDAEFEDTKTLAIKDGNTLEAEFEDV